MLKPLLPPHIAALKPVNPGMPALIRKIGNAATLQLASNENPLGPSPKAKQALVDAVARVHRYPDNQVYALRHRLCRYHGERGGIVIEPEEIAFGNGSSAIIELIARVFPTTTEHAIVGAPSFPAYGLNLAAANVSTSVVPLRDGLHWDLPRVQAAVQPHTKLIFIDNPVNPTSTHIPGEELRRFLRELPPDIVVVVDEAYAEYADDPSYESALAMRDLRERLLVLRTFSKAHALAALRVGYAVGPSALIAPIEIVREPFNISGLAQVAAVAALDDAAHLEQTLTLNARERARLTQALTGLGLRVAPSQANFLFVELPRTAAEVHQKLLERNIVTRLCGPQLTEHLRISTGLPEDDDRMLHALTEVLHELDAARS